MRRDSKKINSTPKLDQRSSASEPDKKAPAVSRPNSPAFDPQLYRIHRPLYPIETFCGLVQALRTSTREESGEWRIADLGCGAGHSTRSLLNALPLARVIGVEPDAAMLEEACSNEALREVRWVNASAENTTISAATQDAVIVGSAFHWMNADATARENEKILRPGGVLLVFEYQFPKAPQLPELNEWIRRQFNLRWRAPQQVPRGDFTQITAVFRHEAGPFRLIEDRRVPMVLQLTHQELIGLLLSQSRVVHYTRALNSSAQQRFGRELEEEVGWRMSGRAHAFDFRLTCALFLRSQG